MCVHMCVCVHVRVHAHAGVMVGKLSETLLLMPDFLALISCCLAARGSYYHSLPIRHWACRDLPFLPALGLLMLTAVLENHTLATAMLTRQIVHTALDFLPGLH